MHSLLFLLVSLLLREVLSQCPDVLPTVTDKIINGNPAIPSFHISLASPANPAIRRCTASRISQRWAITAAHCAVNTSWTARLAGTNSTNGLLVPIQAVFPHPEYLQPTDRRFDIAVVRIDAPEVDDEGVVLLNSNEDLPSPGAYVRVAGYGAVATVQDAEHGDLKHVDIPVVAFPECEELYAGTPNLGELSGEKQLCAGYLRGGCDACSGDSGGPIIQFDDEGRDVQVALVSASRGCALPNFPGIGVRMDFYLPWLAELGAAFRTGTPTQVFGPGSKTPTPAPAEAALAEAAPAAVNTPPPSSNDDGSSESSETNSDESSQVAPRPSASPSPGPRKRPREEPNSESQGTPLGPQIPTDSTPRPASEEVIEAGAVTDDTETEALAPSGEEDVQKGEALSGDAAVAAEGGGVSVGVVVGGVFGGLAVVAVLIVGAAIVKLRLVPPPPNVPLVEAAP